MPQSELGVKVHKMFGTQDTRELPAPAVTKEYPKQQQSYETSDPVPLESFGETLRAPLGYIVAGRVRISNHANLEHMTNESNRAATRPAIAMLDLSLVTMMNTSGSRVS